RLDLVLRVYAGQEFTMTTPYSYTLSAQTIGIWADWSQDGNFGLDNPDERLALNYGDTPQSFAISIPVDVEPGDYIMRVRGSWSNHVSDEDAFACNQKSYGSSVDFTIQVVSLEDCDGTPEGGEVTVDPETGNAGSTYTVSASGYSFGNGL